MDKNTLYTLNINNQNIDLILADIHQSEQYYHNCFCPLDMTVAIMTGSKPVFEKEEVINFFKQSLKDTQRKWLLIVNDDKIIGECVFMDMDNQGYAHFRMAIFDKEYRGLGIGKWALQKSMEYAFNTLNLNEVELEVYEFNHTAQQLYLDVGFKVMNCISDKSDYDNKLYDKFIMTFTR